MNKKIIYLNIFIITLLLPSIITSSETTTLTKVKKGQKPPSIKLLDTSLFTLLLNDDIDGAVKNILNNNHYKKRTKSLYVINKNSNFYTALNEKNEENIKKCLKNPITVGGITSIGTIIDDHKIFFIKLLCASQECNEKLEIDVNYEKNLPIIFKLYTLPFNSLYQGECLELLSNNKYFKPQKSLTTRNETPLHILMQNSNFTDKITPVNQKALINFSNSWINMQDIYGYTPLHIASAIQSASVIQLLFDVPNIDKNITANCGNTPAHKACWRDNYFIKAVFLVDPDIQWNIKNNQGNTAFLFFGLISIINNIKWNKLTNKDATSITLHLTNYPNDKKQFSIQSTSAQINELFFELGKVLFPNAKIVNVNATPNMTTDIKPYYSPPQGQLAKFFQSLGYFLFPFCCGVLTVSGIIFFNEKYKVMI